ncbi:MAG: hypothetical protein AB1486_33280 [Planctomycetota bacterium]
MTVGAPHWLVVGPSHGPVFEALRVACRLEEAGCVATAYDPAPSRDPRWDLLDLLSQGKLDGLLILDVERLTADLLMEARSWGLRVAVVASQRFTSRPTRWLWLLRAAERRAATTSGVVDAVRLAGVDEVVLLAPAIWTPVRERAGDEGAAVVVVAGHAVRKGEARILRSLQGHGPVEFIGGPQRGSRCAQAVVDETLARARLIIDADQARGLGGPVDLSCSVRSVPGLPGGRADRASWGPELVRGARDLLEARGAIDVRTGGEIGALQSWLS